MPRKRNKQRTQSDAYRAGFGDMLAYVSEHGRYNVSPSAGDLANWPRQEAEYRRGWRAAQRHKGQD